MVAAAEAAPEYSLEVSGGAKVVGNNAAAFVDDDGRQARTGTMSTCVAHIITAVIGSGVLSLAWSTAQLGWVAGPACMVAFAFVTGVSVFLLSECYRQPGTGARNYSYMAAVRANLGEKCTWACGLLQYLSMYGTAIAYVITTGKALMAINKSNCYHKGGRGAHCEYGNTTYMLLFAAVEVLFSLIPDFHNMWWLSVVAAVMSFSYSSIGFGLGLAKVIGDGNIKGGLGGVPMATTSKKLWVVCQALGDVAFAYPYTFILLEIQDTLKSPPSEDKTMKKASVVSILITTFFYLCCGCFGYAAFGDDTPGNLLTGFGFYEPFWLVDFANVCIVVHLVGGYQMYSQPIFAFFDRFAGERYPNSSLVTRNLAVKLPCGLRPYKLNLFRLCFRTLYVVSTAGVALLFPYFNQVLGVLGALNFWPLAIYFPVELYFVRGNITPWTRKWVVLEAFSLGCLLVSILALVGSIQGIVSAKSSK